jgi:hypothetical protein
MPTKSPYVYIVTGKSRDISRNAPTGARVAIHYPKIGRTIEILSDENGRYSVEEMPAPGKSGATNKIARGSLDSPPSFQRWTVEMGKVEGIGGDCAIDVLIPNTYEMETMMSLLVCRGAANASYTYASGTAGMETVQALAPACERCDGGQTVMEAVGPIDSLSGQPDGTVEIPCPDCAPAGMRERLEYLRGELRAERISYGELAELQGLAEHVGPDDAELLEAAGVPEHDESAEGDL